MSQTKYIESLSQDQISKFPEYVKEWTSYGLCTEPIDKKMATEGVIEAYKIAGLKPPKIIWTGSPMSNVLHKITLQNIHSKTLVGDSVWDSVRRSVCESVLESVWESVMRSVWDSVEDSVRYSVRRSVGDSVWDSVRRSAWESVGESVRDSVGDSVRRSVWESVRDSVWDSVEDSVGDSVGRSVGDSVLESVWDSVGDSVRRSVRESVRDSVWDSVEDSVGRSVGDSVWESVRRSVGESCYGQHDAHWLAFYSFFRNECGLIEETNSLNGLIKLCKSANWIYPFKNICFVSDRHNICNLQDGVIHAENGPAIAYLDGYSIWALWGVSVPQWLAETSIEKLNIKDILKIKNADVKAVGLKRYGPERLIENGYGKVIEDKYAESGYKLIDLSSLFESYDYAPHLYMKNPSVEGLVHCEGVPQEIKTIDQALKWREDRMEEQFTKVIHT